MKYLIEYDIVLCFNMEPKVLFIVLVHGNVVHHVYIQFCDNRISSIVIHFFKLIQRIQNNQNRNKFMLMFIYAIAWLINYCLIEIDDGKAL